MFLSVGAGQGFRISAIPFLCGLTGDALSVPRFPVCLVKPVPFLTQRSISNISIIAKC